MAPSPAVFLRRERFPPLAANNVPLCRTSDYFINYISAGLAFTSPIAAFSGIRSASREIETGFCARFPLPKESIRVVFADFAPLRNRSLDNLTAFALRARRSAASMGRACRMALKTANGNGKYVNYG